MTGTGIGAIGAMIWIDYYSHFSDVRLILDSLPHNYLSYKTKTNQIKTSLQNMMKLANVDQSHPFSLCALRH